MRMDTTAVSRRRRLSAPVVLLLAAALAIIAPQACAACSCLPMTFSEAADQAEVVFVGTVTGSEAGSQNELGPSVDVTFEVSEVYAGSVPSRAVVNTADNSAACGFTFEPGQAYVVLAQTSGTGLATNLCMGTALASEVGEEDLGSLGPPSAPAAASPGGGATGEAMSQSAPLGLIGGGLALGAVLAALVIWWQRHRVIGPERRHTSSGEALPRTEAS
jgi:hypothetical protein